MMKNNYALVLRTCNADITSYNNFKYPKKGLVEAPDWEPTYKCGHGLHGLPFGCGNVDYLNISEDAVWQIIKVKITDGYLTGQDELQDKCKFCKGNVVYTGKREGALRYLDENGAIDKPVIFSGRTAGDWGTATAGYWGIIQIKYWDADRYRIKTGYIGENGIEAKNLYKLNERHEFVGIDQ
jgi:hypothetical protein